MKSTAPRFSPRLLLLAAGSAVLMAAPLSASWAGTGAKSAKSGSPEATYRYEREKCLSGRTHQDRATCLKEAGAALAEARRGRLDNGVSERQLAEITGRDALGPVGEDVLARIFERFCIGK